MNAVTAGFCTQRMTPAKANTRRRKEMKLGAVVFVVVFFVVAGVTTAACPQPPVETSVDLDAYLGVR